MAIVPQLQSISIHAPRTGSDSSILPPTAWTADFNPRSPHGERQQRRRRAVRTCAFQSTLPARGATYVGNHSAAYSAFQSTLPARGATLRWTVKNTRLENFNPRSPHGERHNALHTDSAEYNFNPRSPHGERLDCQGKRVYRSQFQSTLPARGATAWTAGMLSWTRRISIHAPRTGSDPAEPPAAARAASNFNPRSPHGERRGRDNSRRGRHAFQSTLPARGATRMRHATPRRAAISIHAPRTGSDNL